jgi:hypothetical protein
VTGYLTYDANVARLDDLQRRAGRRLAVRDAVTRARACGAEPITIRRRLRPRLRPRWAYRTA